MTFQVPAVLQSCETSKHGITIVASYSEAFLHHHVDVLRTLGIPVGAISSTKSHGARTTRTTTTQRKRVLEHLRQGRIRILYLFAPFLGDSDVIQAVNSSPGGVHRVVIEAVDHSSSQVGKFLHHLRNATHLTHSPQNFTGATDLGMIHRHYALIRTYWSNSITVVRLISVIRPNSVVALTGSCHPDILHDVCQTFKLPKSSSHSLSMLPPPKFVPT